MSYKYWLIVIKNFSLPPISMWSLNHLLHLVICNLAWSKMVSPHYEFRIGFIDCRIENWYATIYTRKWLLSTMHSELVPVGSTWFFKLTSCMFCIHIVYRGIRILHELFVNASSISLCVWFFIHIGYQVSWFFVSCLYVILQHHFLCVFLFTLVTGVS